MKIIAVINTHNRLSLLQDCVSRVRSQSHLPDKIIVINNGSTDGTKEWLQQQVDIIAITQPNYGGSYGFNIGIKEAAKLSPDWIWIMDDDTFPKPNALEALLSKVQQLGAMAHTFGFLSSQVVWRDGSLHQKNQLFYDEEEYTVEGKKIKDLYPLSAGTFVSLLVSYKAVCTTGLPIKDFFIWYDDVEYTQRITRCGFQGGFVKDSIVLHQTPDNVNNNVFSDSGHSCWKYFYGFRNSLYLRRKRKGYGSFCRNFLKYLFIWPVLILIKRKNNRWNFIKTVWQGTWASLRFRPKVEGM